MLLHGRDSVEHSEQKGGVQKHSQMFVFAKQATEVRVQVWTEIDGDSLFLVIEQLYVTYKVEDLIEESEDLGVVGARLGEVEDLLQLEELEDSQNVMGQVLLDSLEEAFLFVNFEDQKINFVDFSPKEVLHLGIQLLGVQKLLGLLHRELEQKGFFLFIAWIRLFLWHQTDVDSHLPTLLSNQFLLRVLEVIFEVKHVLDPRLCVFQEKDANQIPYRLLCELL